MQSLDPRITRLNIADNEVPSGIQKSPDQLVTFEVFLQKRENMPFEHAGIVHAPDESLALILAKEQFSRRSTCSGMMVANTKNIVVSPYTDMEEDVYNQVEMEPSGFDDKNAAYENYLIFHLTRRGKQHKYAGIVEGKSFEDAFKAAKYSLKEDKPVLNVWLIREKDLFEISEEDKVIWNTLPEKLHRDVTSYRAKEKLDSFKTKDNEK